MNSATVRVWVEVTPTRSTFDGSVRGARLGKTFKRRPPAERLAPGAIAVELALDVPYERLEHVIKAVVPSAPPVEVHR